MALANVGDIYRVSIVNVGPEHTAVNVRYINITGFANDGNDEGNICNALFLYLQPFYGPLLTTNTTFDHIGIQRWYPLPHPLQFVSNLTPVANAQPTPGMPGQVCGIFTLQTGIAGRSQRGRVYVPYPSDTDNTTAPHAGNPTPGYMTRLGQLAAKFLGSVSLISGTGSVTFTNVIWHKKTNSFTPIVQARANVKWATQRRRGTYGAARR